MEKVNEQLNGKKEELSELEQLKSKLPEGYRYLYIHYSGCGDSGSWEEAYLSNTKFDYPSDIFYKLSGDELKDAVSVDPNNLYDYHSSPIWKIEQDYDPTDDGSTGVSVLDLQTGEYYSNIGFHYMDTSYEQFKGKIS